MLQWPSSPLSPLPLAFFLEKGWEEGECKEAVCHGVLSLVLFSFKC